MVQIAQTKTTYLKKTNTKTAYKIESVEVETISEKEYNLTVKDETLKWFRRLGGSETVVMSYTCEGYKAVKLTSTSPDKQKKIVREFEFKYIN